MTRWATIRRRLVTIPLLLVATALVVPLFPLLLLIAGLIDAIRTVRTGAPAMGTRLVTFFAVYLMAETVGVIALALVWLTTPGRGMAHRRFRGTFAVQKAWATVVFAAVRRLFRLDLVVEGLEAVDPPPFIIIGRHTSIIDNLLPTHFIARPNDTHIRYVMKDELLIDPALDVGGLRLGNHFVRRSPGESEREAELIGAMATRAGSDEVLLIYPEGTRFSRAKLDRLKTRLADRDTPLGELVASLRHLLPPRLAGTAALLDATDWDVVVMAHHGLDGFARIQDIWQGALVGRRIDVRFERIPRSAIPAERTARITWLYGLWREIDHWVERKETRT